jgi:hypothetical protein
VAARVRHPLHPRGTRVEPAWDPSCADTQLHWIAILTRFQPIASFRLTILLSCLHLLRPFLHPFGYAHCSHRRNPPPIASVESIYLALHAIVVFSHPANAIAQLPSPAIQGNASHLPLKDHRPGADESCAFVKVFSASFVNGFLTR